MIVPTYRTRVSHGILHQTTANINKLLFYFPRIICFCNTTSMQSVEVCFFLYNSDWTASFIWNRKLAGYSSRIECSFCKPAFSNSAHFRNVSAKLSFLALPRTYSHGVKQLKLHAELANTSFLRNFCLRRDNSRIMGLGKIDFIPIFDCHIFLNTFIVFGNASLAINLQTRPCLV